MTDIRLRVTPDQVVYYTMPINDIFTPTAGTNTSEQVSPTTQSIYWNPQGNTTHTVGEQYTFSYSAERPTYAFILYVWIDRPKDPHDLPLISWKFASS